MEPLLSTKFYIPPARPRRVPRPNLIERLNEGLGRKLILVSAPAGFGKTTLLSEWVSDLRSGADQARLPGSKIAWLSLDEDDNDPARFLTYLVSALNRNDALEAEEGECLLGMLQSPQSTQAVLTSLINALARLPQEVVLVLDDYHAVESAQVDEALSFFLESLPPQLHLLVATRQDPNLPIARLRARGELTELRAADLRFAPAEAAQFFNQVMGLDLSGQDIAILEARTEGWIAGLQLAALSMRGHDDVPRFIQSFSGSHQYVLDYLVEEVLKQQPENIQRFLLCTSILDRMCGPLCDAILRGEAGESTKTLAALERANLFIVPLDDERRWYRYHHLFGELLRQRWRQQSAWHPDETGWDEREIHIRASQWYEEQDLELEAFQQAAAAQDVDRALRLVEGRGTPLHFRGMVAPVLRWLQSLPTKEFDARPALWVTYAAVLVMTAQPAGIEEKLRAAEVALKDAQPDEETRNLIGHIASIRAAVAVPQQQVETILSQAKIALEYVRPDNLPVLAGVYWSLGVAHTLEGDHPAASQAFSEAIDISRRTGHNSLTIMVMIGLGKAQVAQNQLYLAAETMQEVLQLAGDPPLPISKEAYLVLAEINYEWDNLKAAQLYGQQSLHLARQMENKDIIVAANLFLARLELIKGNLAEANQLILDAEQVARQHRLVYRKPQVIAVRLLWAIQEGNLDAAAELLRTHHLPLSQARLHLALGDPSAALEALKPHVQQAAAKGSAEERLKALALWAAALQAQGETEQALEALEEALRLGATGGFVRTLIDEGAPMFQLLSIAVERGILPEKTSQLLAAFDATQPGESGQLGLPDSSSGSMIEPLSPRELEVLQLVAQGLTNRQIGERLFLALDTVKGHNRRIYAKLQVQRRTEAIARARQLGLI